MSGQVSDWDVFVFWIPMACGLACLLVSAVHVLHCVLIEPSSIRMDAAGIAWGMGLPDLYHQVQCAGMGALHVHVRVKP